MSIRRFFGLAIIMALCNAFAGSMAAQPKYTVTSLGTFPGGNASYANGINNAGEVVGFAYIATGNTNTPYPFLYNNGAMHNLGSPGVSGGGATAINDSGQVVGSFNHGAFLY